MIDRLPALASITAALLLTTGCEMSYFAADVQASEVCIVDMAVQFPGVPAVVGAGELATSLETAVGEDDLGLRLSDDVEIDVAVLSVLFAPRVGINDLAFVEEIAVAVGADESELPRTVVVDMTSNDLSNGTLYAEPEAAVDVTAHIRAGELVMDFELSGDLPENDWEANIDLCMSAGAGYVAPI